jgi:hypothetical protein
VRRKGRESVGRIPPREREIERFKLVAFNLTAKEICPGYLLGTDHERGIGRATESAYRGDISCICVKA